MNQQNIQVKKPKPPNAVGLIPWIYNKPPGFPDRHHQRYLQSQLNAIAPTNTYNISGTPISTTNNAPAGQGRKTKKIKKTLRRKSMRLRRK